MGEERRGQGRGVFAIKKRVNREISIRVKVFDKIIEEEVEKKKRTEKREGKMRKGVGVRKRKNVTGY